MLLIAAFSHPGKPLDVRKVDNERVIAAASRLIGSATQVSLSELLYPIGGNKALLTPCLSLFLPGGSIHGNRLKESCLVMVKNVGLRSTNIRIYLGGAFGAVAQEKFPDEPSTAKRSQETTSCWPQW
jgi:hypothetical protein